MEQVKSLESLLTELLIEAQEEHHRVAGLETQSNWPQFYGRYVAHKLGPVLTKLQAVPVCDTSHLNDKVSEHSRIHVG